MNHKHINPAYRVLHNPEAMHGTSQIGSVTTPYSHLVSLFGEPLPGDDRKNIVQWLIETEAGVGTIYDYSFGNRTTPVEAITDWHVGGKNAATYQVIVQTVEDT